MASTVWKGYLSSGLVSFPVRLFSAARAEAVHFHMLHKKDFSRVKEVWYCAEEDKPIERSDIVKGYEVEKGEYITVDDDELKKIAPTIAMHNREHVVLIIAPWYPKDLGNRSRHECRRPERVDVFRGGGPG
jgi:Ku protein